MSDFEREKMKKQQELEQSLAFMAQEYPAMWYRMYANLLVAGFNEEQAMKVVITAVHGSFGGRLNA